MGTFLILSIICLLLGILFMYMASKSAPSDNTGPVEGCGCVLFIVGLLWIIGIVIVYFLG